MAGSVFSEMVVAVSAAGGLGSLPCALLSREQMCSELEAIRRQTSRPVHVNFFCHTPPRVDINRERLWTRTISSPKRRHSKQMKTPSATELVRSPSFSLQTRPFPGAK